jgi:hypothetical protein
MYQSAYGSNEIATSSSTPLPGGRTLIWETPYRSAVHDNLLGRDPDTRDAF